MHMIKFWWIKEPILTKRSLALLLLWGTAATVAFRPLSRAEEPVSFVKDIQPIMEKSCWTCHGATMQLSKLDLRTREGALKGGEHGPSIVPGKADESKLYRLVAGLEKPG